MNLSGYWVTNLLHFWTTLHFRTHEELYVVKRSYRQRILYLQNDTLVHLITVKSPDRLISLELYNVHRL